MFNRQQANEIAIFNDKFSGGGVERIISYMSARLFSKNQGIVLLFDDSKVDFEYGGQLISLGIKAPPYSNILEEAFYLLKALLKLVYAKRKYRIKLCISQKEGPNFINVLSTYSKSIVTVHESKSAGIKYKGLKRSIVRHLIEYLYNKADCIVTVSRGIAQDLADNFNISTAKLKTIYNPCDIDMIEDKLREPIENKYNHLFNGRTIVTAGRLVTQKGHWHLIRAFTEVKRRIKDAKLIILGEGDHLKYLQELTSELGLSKSVHFLGYQQNPFRFINKSDVFVLTSLWEGFGAAITEAMTCRVPVISTDCPSGPREILAPNSDIKLQAQENEFAEYGILTPPVEGTYKSADEVLTYSETCIAKAIVRILEDPSLHERYVLSGYTRAQEFNIEKYVSEWKQLITSV